METPERPPGVGADRDAGTRLSIAAGRTARDQTRLEASQEAIASEVVAFQLARQRAGLAAAQAVDRPDLVAPLSAREEEVARLVAAGRTDGEIATELFISKKTASVHVANIKGKLAASSRVEIAVIARRLGLVDDSGAAGAPAREPLRPVRQPIVCPFKGLASFDIADAGFFFGRERAVAELVARLAGSTFIGLAGPSGSGKSSVVRAGLVPALRDGVLPASDRWPVAIIRPGEHPVRELARALAMALPAETALPVGEPAADVDPTTALDRLSVGERLILVIDQFEEAFTVAGDAAERAAFLDGVVALARDPQRRALLVVTIRADFYGRGAEHRDLADLLSAGTVLLGPMTAEEMTRAIEWPARAAGLRVEPELTAALVADVLEQPGGLPLLSTTLLDLWQQRDGRVLRRDTYVRLGGVSGAVARLAETAFGRLTETEQAVARSMLLRLSTTGDDGQVVRKRAPVADFDAETNSTASGVLGVLIDSRLVTVDEGFVELAHEALLREWPRMRVWLEADAEGRRIQLHLARAAQEWRAAGDDPAELYRGSRLAAALEWAADHEPELNDLEGRFLAAGRAASEAQVGAQRQMNSRLRRMLGMVGVLLAVAVLAGLAAVAQAGSARDQAGLASQRAQDAQAARDAAENAATLAAQNATDAQAARDQALAEARFARSRELAASSTVVLGTDPSLAKLLAVAAADAMPDAVTETALHQAWLADQTTHRYAEASTAITRLTGDLDPSGRFMVAAGGPIGGARKELQVIDLATDTVAWSYRPAWAAASIGPGFFSRDGSRVYAGLYWAPDTTQPSQAPPPNALGILVFDSTSGHLIQRLDDGVCGASLVVVSSTNALTQPLPDDSAPACYGAGVPTAKEVIDLAVGARRRLSDHALEGGALSQDGRYVGYTDTSDKLAVVVDLTTGKRAMAFPEGQNDNNPTGQNQPSNIRGISPDGTLALFGDQPILVLDVATGKVRARLPSGAGENYGITFGRTGSRVYLSGRDSTLRIVDAATGELVASVPAVGGGRASASDDGRVLVTDFATNVATLVRPGIRGELGTIATCSGFTPGFQLTSVGGAAALSVICGDHSPTYLIDLLKGTATPAPGDDEGQGIALSPDGTWLARQTRTGIITHPIEIDDARTGRMVRQLDGLCSFDETLADFAASPGCRPFPATPFPMWNGNLVFSPDGGMLLGVHTNGTQPLYAAVWDARTGKLLKVLDVTPWGAIFTPDSRELILLTKEGSIVAMSTATWQVTRRATFDPAVEDRGRMGLVGFLPDGSTLVGVSGLGGTGGAWLQRIDLASLTFAGSNRAHNGSVKSASLSPDGTLLATGASDGSVRVWEAATGSLLHEFSVPGQAQGVAFLANDRLAVAPQAGDVLIMSLDGTQLLQAVRQSLTRGFTPDECTRFGFGASCPTLDAMRAGTDTAP